MVLRSEDSKHWENIERGKNSVGGQVVTTSWARAIPFESGNKRILVSNLT